MTALDPDQQVTDLLQIIGDTTCDVLHKMVNINALITSADTSCEMNRHKTSNQMIASIKFSGDISGQFSLWIDRELATHLIADMLGVAQDQLPHPQLVDSAIGEIANVIVGNTISSLYFDDLNVGFTPPQMHAPNITIESDEGKYAGALNILINDINHANIRLTVNNIEIAPKHSK